MKRILLFLLASIATVLHAQNYDFAERVYQFAVTGQGDSIHNRLLPALKSQVSAAQLGQAYNQLVVQMGALKARSEWRTDTVFGKVQYLCDLTFERMPLTFCLVVDNDQHIAALLFQPQQPPKKAPAAPERKANERDITVVCGDIRLPGTLCLPLSAAKETDRRFPIVILVHGSGPNDRDETIGDNKPFREMADSLAAAGIATLRYDKRTYVYRNNTKEVSGGLLNYDSETVDDALAAIRLARSLPEADQERIYIMGHSLGGMLLPRIAERDFLEEKTARNGLAGLISWAGAARDLDIILKEQLRYLGSIAGQTTAEADSKAQEILSKLPAEYLEFDREYDPAEVAKGLKSSRDRRTARLPMLFINGGNDYQVTQEDFKLWQDALGKYKDVTFCWIPEADHLLRPLPRKAVAADYLRHVPLSSKAVSAVRNFVLSGK